MTGFITLAIVLFTGGIVLYGYSNEGNRPGTGQRDLGGRPLLGTTNDTVLVYDDGNTGAFFFDPKQRALVHEELEGQQPNDAPRRLSVVAGEIYVGWDPVVALPLAGTGEGRVVSSALYHLPVVGTSSVWLVDYPSRQPGAGPVSLRLVNSEGTVEERINNLAINGVPVAGLLEGVVFQTETGITVVDTSGDQIASFGGSGASVGDAQGETVAWCTADCTELHLTSLDGTDHKIALPAGRTSFDGRSVRFAPDGDYIGVSLVTAGADGVSRTDAGLIDVSSRQIEILTKATVMAGTTLGWSPDGGELFFAGPHLPTGGTFLGLWSKDDKSLQTSEIQVQLPVTSFVVSTAGAAHNRVARAITGIGKCGAQIVGDCIVFV